MRWLLWKRQCRLLFEEDVGVPDDVLATGNHLLMENSNALIWMRETCARSELVQSWCKSPTGWVKMNVDASVSIDDQTVGVGGIIRDAVGSWQFGFARYVGRCNALLAEIWAIHDGLLHARELGYHRVELESDCLEAVHIVTCQSGAWGGSALLLSINRLLAMDWEVVVRHINRNMNKVADSLAKRGRASSIEPTNFSLPPEGMEDLVIQEQRAMSEDGGLPARDAPMSSDVSVGIG
ncbi:hypothetical protein GQ457_01G054220 [Hibiscus cannabinus]